jgi:hypothetical protein
MKKQLIASILIISVVFISCEKSFDYNPAEIKPFVGLPKPAEGKGYQIHVPTFPVPSNFEREFYIRLPIGNKERIYVTAFEAKMREGTHHFIAYPIDDENDPKAPPIGVLRDQNLANGKLNLRSNPSMKGFIVESTAPEYRIDIPGGYAIPFDANVTLDFNSHYFNKTANTLFGEVFFNVYTKPKSQIKGELVELNMQPEQELNIKPNATTIVETTTKFDELVRLVMLTSHNHKRGKKFEMFYVGGPKDGQKFYSSTDYVHPVINYYETPLTFQKGEGIRMVATYVNETNRTIQFGVTSEDEMMIGYGYYIKN